MAMDINQQHRFKTRIGAALRHITLFIAMSIICIPGLWIVLNSFRPTVDIMAKPPVWVPRGLNLDNYRAMFGGAGEGGAARYRAGSRQLETAASGATGLRDGGPGGHHR